jgi:hypothetical protein
LHHDRRRTGHLGIGSFGCPKLSDPPDIPRLRIIFWSWAMNWWITEHLPTHLYHHQVGLGRNSMTLLLKPQFQSLFAAPWRSSAN